MSFDWKEFLNFARVLNGEEDVQPVKKETAARCGVSRAYYAAFCYARVYANSKGFTPRENAEDHGRLRHWFKERRRYSIASQLDALREWRNACDYDDILDADFDHMLTNSIRQAQKVIDSLT